MIITKFIKNLIILILPFHFLNFSQKAFALNNPEELKPSVLLQLDDYFSHHVIVAEKSTHKLYLFKNENGIPRLLRSYQMATGKKAGDKISQGDFRTPEGVYVLNQFLTHEDLVKRHGKQGEIYGVGAFVLNYPNPIDLRAGKTGGGIWLHSTNDETRIDKGLDSRGCIVTANSHLIDISKYIELNRTSVVVVHDLKWIDRSAWNNKKKKILKTVNDWVASWKNEELNEYIKTYHDDFYDPSKGTLAPFKTYKRAVFAQPGKPDIQLDKISILKTSDYAIVSFKQSYTSNTIQDLGKKSLYLKRDSFYNWKIVAESWTKAGLKKNKATDSMAFEPSMRFFKTNSPHQILGKALLQAKVQDNNDSSSN